MCSYIRFHFIPFFTRRHMIPFSEFARLFASRGVHVTIITTPCNAQLLQNSIDKVWHIGPAALMLPITGENKSEVNDDYDHASLTWLKSKEPSSVVFVSFGTICRLSDSQLYEMACGLESSGAHFLWLVQGKDNQSEEDKEKWLPKGFGQRMKENNRGMIITGWAPHPAILKDPAIGAFLTHCGSSSAMEGISSGVPMITFPVFYEQFYDERLIAQVHGIGVEVGAQDWWETLYDAKDKLVSRDNIENATRRIMDDGDEAKQVRRREREMGEKASKAVQGGSSQNILTALIEDLQRMSSNRCKAVI